MCFTRFSMEGRQKMSRSFSERFAPPSDELGLNRAWHTRRDVKVPCDTTRELVLQHLKEHVVIVSPSHGLTETMAEQLRSRGFVSKDGDKKCFKQHSCDEQGTVPEAGMRLESGVFHRISTERSPFAVLLDPFDAETVVVLHCKSFNVGGHAHRLSSCFQFRIKRDKDWKGTEEYNAMLGTELLGDVLFPEATDSNVSSVYFSSGMLLYSIESKNNHEFSMMAHSILDRESGPFLIRGRWTLLRTWLIFTDHHDYNRSFKLYCLNLWDVAHSAAFVQQLGEVPDSKTLFHLDLSAFSERKKIASASLEWE
jgi:hypothetical protein